MRDLTSIIGFIIVYIGILIAREFFMRGKISKQPNIFINFINFQLNSKHPLCLAADLMNWNHLEESLKKYYDEKKGRPGVPIRVLCGLTLLKHLYNLSDRELLRQLNENVYMQYFCGYKEFQPDLRISDTTLVKFRQKLEDKDKEVFLKTTLDLAIKLKLLKNKDIENIIIDTTAQEKNIQYPTDAKLYYKMITRLRKVSRRYQLPIKQSYERVSKSHLFKANQSKRNAKIAKKSTNKLKTYLRRLLSDIWRKLSDFNYPQSIVMIFDDEFKKAERLLEQRINSSNKLYSLHETHVACIAKGKQHKKYEFGNKVSIATSLKKNFIVGCVSFVGAPFDGKTLKDTIANVEDLTNIKPFNAFVDNGYPGYSTVDKTKILMHKEIKNYNATGKKQFKRRAAIEPVIGHMKQDHRMNRNFLSGIEGDIFNAILSASAFNLRKILNYLRNKHRIIKRKAA